MTEPDLVVRTRRAWVDGAWRAAQVVVSGGRITAIDVPDDRAAVELADDEVLLPGLVDSHVHVNEPGRTAWEGFASATLDNRTTPGGLSVGPAGCDGAVPPTLAVLGIGHDASGEV